MIAQIGVMTAYAVFNPTANDWLNANEVQSNPQTGEFEAYKDLQGIRYILTKKSGSQAYNFEGVGNYTNGIITNIEAQELSPQEQLILANSPRFMMMDISSLMEAPTQCTFSTNETEFVKRVMWALQHKLLTQNRINGGSPADLEGTYANIMDFTRTLQQLDIDTAYNELNNILVDTIFTQAIKDDFIGAIEGHLKKYPR